MAENDRTIQQAGELPDQLDPDELAFEIDSILIGADVNYILFEDPTRLERAKLAVRRLLDVASSPASAGP